MKGKYTYKLNLDIGFPTATRDGEVKVEGMGYSREEWDKLTIEQMEIELDNAAQEWANNYIEIYWS
jgi:hypothetical protein